MLTSVAMDSLCSDIVIILFVKLYISVPLHLLCVSLLVLCLWESVCVSLCVVDQSDYKSCCERTSKSLWFYFGLSFIASFAFSLFW